MVAAIAVASATRSGGLSRPPERARAERDFLAAQHARLAGRDSLARGFLRDAFLSDPTWPLPVLGLHEVGVLLSGDRVAKDIARAGLAAADTAYRTCIGALLDANLIISDPDDVRGTTPEANACADLLRLLRPDAQPSRHARHAARVRERFPQSGLALRARFVALRRAGDAELAVSEARLACSGSVAEFVKTYCLEAAHALHALGRHDEAQEWETRTRRAAERAGPGAVVDYWGVMVDHETRFDGEADRGLSEHAVGVMRSVIEGTLAVAPQLDRLGRLRAMRFAALAAGALNDLDRLATIAGQAAAVADSIGAPALATQLTGRRGHALMKLGRLAAAESALTRASDRARRSGEHAVERDAAHNLLHVWEARGEYTRAVAAGADFRRAAAAESNLPGQMMANHDLAWLHARKGHTRLAQSAFERMVADIDKMGGQHSYFAGEYYELVGHLDRARDQYRRALKEPSDRARALGGMVRVSRALGDTSTALHYARVSDAELLWTFPEARVLLPGVLAYLGRFGEARSALELAQRHARTQDRWDALANLAIELADVQLRSRDFRSAALQADSAAVWAHRVASREREIEARAIGASARAHLHRDRARVAADYRALVRDASGLPAPALLARVHQLRGDALVAASEVGAAIDAYASAATAIQTVAERLEADESRANFRSTQLSTSNRALQLIISRGGEAAPDLYARWSLWRKGRALADRVGVLAALQRNLGPDRALIDYVLLDSVVAALVVSSSDVSLHTLPMHADSVTARITRMRSALTPRVGGALDSRRIGFDGAAAHDLYRALVEPLRLAIGNRTQLIVVPDRLLYAVPFDALVTGTDNRGPTYLIDRFTITVGVALDLEPNTRPTRVRLTGIAPSTLRDAGIADEVGVLRDAGFTVIDDARVAEVEAAAREADVLHFATHGEANDRDPRFARLLLGSTWLHGYEIAGWTLPGSLVVLSACETGTGSIAGGEGALSLSRAFLRTGARGTIATLWPVGAPTADLMRVFYDRYRGSGDPAAALRAARLALRNGKHDQPFYWAPFILTMRGL